MCHRASAANAGRCPCGHELGHGLETLCALLHDQHVHAWITLVALLVLGGPAVAGMIYAALHGFIVLSALGFTAEILLTARAVRAVQVTRARLRQLDRRVAAVPRAIVHRR